MTETELQNETAKYIRQTYPDVIFTSESSGHRVKIGMARRMKAQRSEGSLPDLIILEPRGRFHGLVMELKVEQIWKKDGSLRKGRAEEQAKMLNRLSDKGYVAVFSVGLDDTKEIIDRYMKL